MARKTVADSAKAKAAKQKKIVIGLAAVLVLAVGYAFMTMRGLHSGSVNRPEAATAATSSSTTTTTAVTTPVATPSGTAAPDLSTGTPTVSTSSGTASSATSSSALTSSGAPLVSVVSPPTGAGQLQSFSLFESKDPFAAAGPASPAASSSSSKSGSGSSKKGSGASKSGTGGGSTTPTTPAVPPASAVISVNGIAADVTAGTNFPVSTDPSANGIFTLVSLTATTAKIAIAGGSYASGQTTLTLKVNQPVTLVNTADGTSYKLELFPQGTPVATGSTSTSPGVTAVAPPTTTPGTTTTTATTTATTP